MSGKVVHFEVPYDDAERAWSFYRDVFGWNISPIPELHYDIVTTGEVDEQGYPAEKGYIGGGMIKRESPTDRPVITIDVDDIDQALVDIEAAGGMKILGRQEVGEIGYAAYFRDVEGNLMGLWQQR